MTASAAPTGKILLAVHTATNPTLPGAPAPHFPWPPYFNFTVGNRTTGETGRLIAALRHVAVTVKLLEKTLGIKIVASNLFQLFLPVPYHCFSGLAGPAKAEYFRMLSTIPEVQHLLDHLAEYCNVFDLDPEMVKDLLANAHLDPWDNGTTEVKLITTAGECLRAVAYAVAHGFSTVISVSTGAQHAARALQTMFLAAKGTGLFVLGCCAEAEVHGLKGRQTACFDPTHLPGTIIDFANRTHCLDVLLPMLFSLGMNLEDFVETVLVPEMRRRGIQKNTLGEEI